MKNLKKTVGSIAILSLIGALSINAQINNFEPSFGIKGGVNLSNLYGDNGVDDNNILTSFNVGFFTSIPLSESIALAPELLYSRKGAEMKYNNAFASGASKFKLSYIELPILIKANLTKNFNVQFGPYTGFLIDAKATNEDANGETNYETTYSNEDFNTFDYGLSAGLGLDFANIGIGIRYNYGLNTVGKERTVLGQTYIIPDAKNSSLSLYTAIKF